MARKNRSYGETAELSLTSMMDVMTIILVFLLKQIDEGQLVTAAESLVLPNSTSQKSPEEMAMILTVDPDFVLVDNEMICLEPKVDGEGINKRTTCPKHEYLTTSMAAEQDTDIGNRSGILSKVLTEKREEEMTAFERECTGIPGRPGTANPASCSKLEEGGKVIVQLDKNTPFGTMYSIMALCGYSGFSDISFAVNMKNPPEE
jgi:biopolymer transport protein ExbD